MNKPIEPQIIHQNGMPAFAVIPWKEYQKLVKASEKTESPDVWFPHDVVHANTIQGKSLIKAWREYLNLTQQQLADKSGLTQSAIARMEIGDTVPRIPTLKKIASAMNISLEQLTD